MNDLGGTYAHRVLFVAYDKNGVVINHDVATNDFREKNKFEQRPDELRLTVLVGHIFVSIKAPMTF
ncbi:TPA: hypothetical protein UZ441_004563 [Escherichia coli]|nr:hypothetical protein [Escherichia coli]HEL8044487.1 hypothetical protein [Escherichia coli]HEL8049286.1 hypothetical protein [Escherichia coli]HEL8054035.1 hypothetical protein [Escherichia coli]HEL8058926.1 hypothetical protein [Escherichia coli]